MDNVIENYKKRLEDKKLSVNTINSYIYDINCFISYLKNEYKELFYNVKKTHVLTFLVDLQKNGKSSSTISRNISSLKSFYEYLREEKLISDNPIQNIHSPKHIRKLPLILEEKEIMKLLSLPDINTFKGSRDSAILELLYSSGIKVSELINIKIQDIVPYASIIHINGKIQRIVPVGKLALKAISNYLSDFRNNKSKSDCEFLFINNSGEALTRQGVWKILKFYENKLELNKELSPQILRNSFAVHLLNHGADVLSVKELMGHKNLTAMQNYMQVTDLKSLQTYKNTHPRA
ncbi:tyrosine-type recombinase/integrase [Sedimentibacter sp. zth1]|uniref:tyrosine-type recombinase/integrase n=1 Tax=Sedimentibacter sp. zth1 TaxID=2816908 RepID=UPI001A91C89D|nr:tyrosine-type recombinase/integrase [Sedimentibacter sp. zth1]QSX06807.1 tyrosine-type recombinase/integrase [Sedimentibacter sp. zth1]